jgi:outer membrane protein, heavy metal efflux system
MRLPEHVKSLHVKIMIKLKAKLNQKRSLNAAFLLVFFANSALLLTGCAKEKYVAKPIQFTQVSAKILAKSPVSADFKTYLVNLGYAENTLPFASWGLDELTLSALYHHPKLNVAKAQMALAEAELQSAAIKANPTVNADIARSNRANDALKPWSLGLNVEIPIETGNKRAIKMEQAQFNVEAAQLDVAEVAWQLRQQLALDLHEYHKNLATISLLQNELQIQDDLLGRLQKRMDIGLQGSTELLEAKIVQQKSVFALQNEQSKREELLAVLAADAGLTLAEFKKISLKPLNLDETLNQHTTALAALETDNNLQQKALLNRIALRKSLAKYAAAEANIKLEVAKQMPDFSLSPGFAFDYGDNIWSLGFSSLLNLLQKHPTLINEATKLREIEGAQFELLQHEVISELSTSLSQYKANQTRLADAKNQLTIQQTYQQKIKKQLDAGLVDKVVIVQAKLNEQLALQQIQNAQFDVLKSALMIENVMQYPLYSSFKLPK